VLILGAFGGELDHSLNNIMVIAKYVEQDMHFTIYDQYFNDKIKVGYLLSKGSVNFTCPKNSIISILPLTKVSTTGLEWDL
jgi:thiamine pyrophosphokinase